MVSLPGVYAAYYSSRRKKGGGRGGGENTESEDKPSTKNLGPLNKSPRVIKIIPEASDMWHDCGEKGHSRGDPYCKKKSRISQKTPEKEGQKQWFWWVVFSPRLWERRESNMICVPGAKSDILTGARIRNPIMDQGCPLRISGIEYAKELCKHLYIDFELLPFDRHPFIHGFDEIYNKSAVTAGIWDMPLATECGEEVRITVYITRGSGIIILGNEICMRSNLIGTEYRFVIPPGMNHISDRKVSLTTYSQPIGPPKAEDMYTYLLVVRNKTVSFDAFFNETSFASCGRPFCKIEGMKDAKAALRFANKLHSYSHLIVKDMKKLCNRANVFTKTFEKSLKIAFNNCRTYASTGHSLQSRSFFLCKVEAQFSDHLQIDRIHIGSLSLMPILHAVEMHTGPFATCFLKSNHVARQLEMI